jgi:hypothetical protein
LWVVPVFIGFPDLEQEENGFCSFGIERLIFFSGQILDKSSQPN